MIEDRKKVFDDYENKSELFYRIGIEYLFIENYTKSNYYFKKSLNYDYLDHSALYNILYCYEMIKDYVDNNNVDIAELMKENNIQKLLKYYEP